MPADPDPSDSKQKPKSDAVPETAPGTPKPASELTPEEQMERFERELKETDWGHQPC